MSLLKKAYSLNNVEYNIYIYVDGQWNVWFKAKEIALILEYNDTKNAIQINIDDCDKAEWKVLASGSRNIETPVNWQPKTIFINESGLYQLMLRSKEPEAVQFRRWVTFEVLPSLRKCFAYCPLSIYSGEVRPTCQAVIDLLNIEQREGFVYVATTGRYRKQGVFKIGCTANIERRMVELNCGRLKEDCMFCIYKLATSDKFATERMVHNELAEYQIEQSELFKVPDVDIIYKCIDIIREQ